MLRSSRGLLCQQTTARRFTYSVALLSSSTPRHQLRSKLRPLLASSSICASSSRPVSAHGRQQQQQRHGLHAPAPVHQQQQRRVLTQAVQVDVLLGGLSSLSGWAVGAALVVGIFLGMVLAKIANNYLNKEADPYYANLENAELRTKVEELQQLVLKVQPLAYKSMRLRFTKGINKKVILGMVDQMLANKEVNIWWLPDSIERVFYFNMMTLMLSVLDEVVDGMSMSLAGHNVRLQLTHLDVAPDGAPTSPAAKKTEELLKHALEPPKTYEQPGHHKQPEQQLQQQQQTGQPQ